MVVQFRDDKRYPARCGSSWSAMCVNGFSFYKSDIFFEVFPVTKPCRLDKEKFWEWSLIRRNNQQQTVIGSPVKVFLCRFFWDRQKERTDRETDRETDRDPSLVKCCLWRSSFWRSSRKTRGSSDQSRSTLNQQNGGDGVKLYRSLEYQRRGKIEKLENWAELDWQPWSLIPTSENSQILLKMEIDAVS